MAATDNPSAQGSGTPPSGPRERLILHVDMDAFFASIEQRDHPEWRGLPVIVGSPPGARGVVSTCSYEARKFGVRSAMPSRQAYQLCPQGLFVPARMAQYVAVSRQVHAIFADFSPLVEPVSIDEAFMDLSGSAHLFGGPLVAAKALKARIRGELALSASIGLASNKFLAKLASDLQKPDGLTQAPTEPTAIAAWLAPLPVTRLWGVGQKAAERLATAGLRRIGDVQDYGLPALSRLLGENAASHLFELAFGRDYRAVETESEEKSISAEHTFDQDESDWEQVTVTLRAQAERVGARLRAAGRLAATAQLKLRWSDFTTITRQAPLDPPTQHDRPLLQAAVALLGKARQARPVRLVGFGVSHLLSPEQMGEERQLELFPDPAVEAARQAATRDAGLDAAVDAIRQRFGGHSLRRGPE